MIGTSKNTGEIISENAFEHKKKKTRVKFNPVLSANRPSNNRAQVTKLLFQFLLTKFSKSELFSCLQKVDQVTNHCKGPIAFVLFIYLFLVYQWLYYCSFS